MNSEIPLFNNQNFNVNNPLINSKNFQNNLLINDENSKENINILNANEIINNLNESNKSINQNNINKNKLTENEWFNYFKQTKTNLEEINKVLLSNVESIDNEKLKLKEALTELIKDLKEKENSLDESLKIISKLKDNYSNLFHQYQALEKKYSKLNEENEILKNNCDISNKNNIEGINKKNDFLKDELNSLKKDNLLLKNNYIAKNNECIKLTKENNENKIIMEDLKQRNLEYLNMIKDREDLIAQYNNQIKNLNDEINNKNEQMKLLVKFSKNINDENKINIKELTKQACQTIKLLYNYNNQNNSLNNNINENINNNENNKFINYIIKLIFDNEDLKDLNLNNSTESKNYKIIFKLKEAIQDDLLLDKNENNINIPKEYFLDLIIKFNLLKTEIYSSFLREFNFVSFLNSLFEKINFKNIKECNIMENTHKINKMKNQNYFLINQNQELKKKIKMLIVKINELNLYIQKLKKDIFLEKNKIKEKVNIIINLHENKINILKDNFNEFKKYYKKEIEIYKNGLNKGNNIYKNNEDITQKKISKNKHKKNKIHSLKIERNISFCIFNFNNNNSLKNEEKPFFSFSKSSNNIDNNNKIPINNSSINTLSFQQKEPVNKLYSNNNNNNDSFNKMNYQQKRIENEKLKEEIQHLKNEITELLQEINNQKLLNDNKHNINQIINKNNNSCGKCKNLNNLIIKLNIPDKNKLIEIKNMILNSPIFDENIKNIINNIFDIFIKLISNNNKSFNNEVKFNLNVDNNKFLENPTNRSYFSELNIKIFSSSELKKFSSLYDEKSKDINELIDIYINRAKNIKNNVNGIKISYDSSISSNTNEDILLSNIKKNKNEKIKEINIQTIDEIDKINKQEDIGYQYKNIHEEIIKLKNEKIIIDNLIELIKNYLIINEKIFQYFLDQKINNDRYKKYSKKIFKIFKESCCYNMDDISDNNIFQKKLIIKLFETIFLHL